MPLPLPDREKPGPASGQPRLFLPQVTLVAISSVAVPATARVLRKTMAHIAFGDAIFFTDADISTLSLPGVRAVAIARLTSRSAYSHFVLKELSQFISTSHMLFVQWDGYVLNPDCWQDRFLDYDYIGAPWPQFEPPWNVGNGGFSLRTHKLLAACGDDAISSDLPEDVAIARDGRRYLEKMHSIRFAPADLAHDFSFERTVPESKTFGFHGAYNMVALESEATFRSIYDGLEQHLLGRHETRDVIGRALDRGWRGLAVRIAITTLIIRFRTGGLRLFLYDLQCLARRRLKQR